MSNSSETHSHCTECCSKVRHSCVRSIVFTYRQTDRHSSCEDNENAKIMKDSINGFENQH